MRSVVLALPLLVVACGESSPHGAAHDAGVPMFEADVGATESDADGDTTPPTPTSCDTAPVFDEPIVLPPPAKTTNLVSWADVEAFDDQTLVVFLMVGSPPASNLMSANVDLRTRTVSTWRSIAKAFTAPQVLDLGGGRIALVLSTPSGGRDLAIATSKGVSPLLSTSIGEVAYPTPFPLGDDGVLAFWATGASILRSGAWSPPLPFATSAGFRNGAPLIDGSVELVLREPTLEGAQSAVRFGVNGTWTSTSRSPLQPQATLLLADGTVIVALEIPIGGGMAEVWTTDARPPRDWSKPSRMVLADGAPLHVAFNDAGFIGPLLFPADGGRAAELVAWTNDCAAGACTHRAITRKFVDGSWQAAIDLSWGTDPETDDHRIAAFDDRTPAFVRGGAFRARVGDTWRDPMGVTPGTLLDEVGAVDANGFWILDTPSAAPIDLLYVDATSHTTTHHDLGLPAGSNVGEKVVDADGAFIASGDVGSVQAMWIHFATPNDPPDVGPIALEDELQVQVAARSRMQRDVRSEIFGVAAKLAKGARVHFVAFNRAGNSVFSDEGASAYPISALSHGCGGAVLYGETTSTSAGSGYSSLVLVPIH